MYSNCISVLLNFFLFCKYAFNCSGFAQEGFSAIVEIGHHPASDGPIKQILVELPSKHQSVPTMCPMNRNHGHQETQYLYDFLGDIHVHGCQISWSSIRFLSICTTHPMPLDPKAGSLLYQSIIRQTTSLFNAQIYSHCSKPLCIDRVFSTDILDWSAPIINLTCRCGAACSSQGMITQVKQWAWNKKVPNIFCRSSNTLWRYVIPLNWLQIFLIEIASLRKIFSVHVWLCHWTSKQSFRCI